MKQQTVWRAVGAVAVALGVAACGGGDSDPVMPTAGDLCGSVGLQPKVFNGSNCANPRNSPVVQLAVLQGGNTYTCSGVMLTPNRVLTAAHCLPAGTSAVAATVWDGNGGSQLLSAQSWAVHPQYLESYSSLVNDAAVITLNGAMPNPTMPLLVSQRSKKGDEVFFAGWGLPSGDLAVGFAKLTKVTDWQLELSFRGQLSNSCAGDSGGPVYRSVGGRMGVVGLTSTGTTRACGAADDSLFTNTQTDNVLGFIRSQAPGAAEI